MSEAIRVRRDALREAVVASVKELAEGYQGGARDALAREAAVAALDVLERIQPHHIRGATVGDMRRVHDRWHRNAPEQMSERAELVEVIAKHLGAEGALDRFPWEAERAIYAHEEVVLERAGATPDVLAEMAGWDRIVEYLSHRGYTVVQAETMTGTSTTAPQFEAERADRPCITRAEAEALREMADSAGIDCVVDPDDWETATAALDRIEALLPPEES